MIMSSHSKLVYAILIIIVKVLYVYLNVLMLPQEWTIYDFDRNIHLDNLIYEIVPFVLCLVAYLVYLKPGHPISFAITIFFCLYVIPSNSCMVLSDYSAIYYFSINTFNIILLLSLGKILCDSKLRLQINDQYDIALSSNKRLQRVIRIMTVFTCLGNITYVYFLRGSISLTGIFSEDIYDTRAVVASLYLENTDGAIAYLMTIWYAFSTSMLILGFYLSLKNRHYFDIVLCFYTFLVLYSFDMQKGGLFKPIIALFVFFLYKSNKIEKADLIFLAGYCVFLVVSLIEYILSNESIVYTVVVRRMAYMPQYLSHAYYDFFNSHDKLWLTRDFFQLEKVVRLFYPGSYEHGAVLIIADNCFPGIPSPNSGLFSEAFAQLGYMGVFLFPLILTLIIRVYYKYSTIFGMGASHLLLSCFVISIINIQVLAPRGILIVLIFILMSLLVRKIAHVK